jgi:hypothetical protein
MNPFPPMMPLSMVFLLYFLVSGVLVGLLFVWIDRQTKGKRDLTLEVMASCGLVGATVFGITYWSSPIQFGYGWLLLPLLLCAGGLASVGSSIFAYPLYLWGRKRRERSRGQDHHLDRQGSDHQESDRPNKSE